MICVLDCGTTNTKAYLITEGAIIGEHYQKLGIKDFAAGKDKGGLSKAVGSMVRTLVEKNGHPEQVLDMVVCFGMITSEAGWLEIPHLVAPVSREMLANSLTVRWVEGVFSYAIPFVFIRGVKMPLAHARCDDNIFSCDFMRGEETQCFGILETLRPSLPVNIMVLSSHTKTIYINPQGEIADCLTTMSGQLYEELVEHTIIGKSVSGQDEQPRSHSPDVLADLAVHCVEDSGLLRAILVPRFMEAFTDTCKSERREFLENVICCEDMKALEPAFHAGRFCNNFIIMGQPGRAKIYENMLKSRIPGVQVNCITGKKQIRDITVAGATLLTKDFPIMQYEKEMM